MPPPVDPYATLDSISRQSALMNNRTRSAFEPTRSNNSSPWQDFDTLWTGSSSANPTPVPSSLNNNNQAQFLPFSAFDADEKMRRALQEQADYELALKLSKADQKPTSANTSWRWN